MGNFSYHVRWGKSMTENSLFSKHLTTIIWQIKYGEVKHCTTFFILNQRPLRVILVTTNNLEMKASLHGRASRTRLWQEGPGFMLPPQCRPSSMGVLRPNKRRGSVAMGSSVPVARGLSGVFPAPQPPSPPGATRRTGRPY